MRSNSGIETTCINTIRTLAMDAVQAANSGHPGAVMAMAPLAYTLFDQFLRFDPEGIDWPNRDRFVLSMGHASMLLYAALHLNGYDVSVDDIRRFRQLHGKCPGHPEYRRTPGVETTTGPLGQGAANSVGMAISGKWLAERFNRPGFELFDYRIFALCSDGDIMEGISAEAASLAGHLGLDNLVWLYDDNRITIDGDTSLAFSEDVGARFEAYHWNVSRVDDVNDLEGLRKAIDAAVAEENRPSLIIVRSRIAWGSPGLQGSAAAHGAPLGVDEVRATKLAYDWDPDLQFHVPKEVTDHIRSRGPQRGRELRRQWQERFEAYRRDHPDLAQQLTLMRDGELPGEWDANLPAFEPDAKGLATRKASGKALNAIAERVPWLFGGSADLAGSNNVLIGRGEDAFARGNPGGRNFYFGIREHSMAAIVNGLALSGMRPYAATFLVFSDYMKPAIRLAAMMRLPVIYVFTHDSLGVGEDGPTHQPIEHLAALRIIPYLDVFRPADAAETCCGWQHAMRTTDRPTALVLTRQNVPILDRAKLAPAEGALRGGYVLADPAGSPDVILIGTGSEVQLCLAAGDTLAQQGIATRVVSMPCRELFDRQPQEYRDGVLLPEVSARVAVEAGVKVGWRPYVGPFGTVVGLEEFGTSAPAAEVMLEFGMTAERVVEAARRSIESAGKSK